MDVVISKSENKNQQMKAVLNGKTTVHFGASGYQDFITHNDPKRRDNYTSRHKKNENWGASGVDIAGFYAKHVFWNKDTLTKSVDDFNQRFEHINSKLK